MCLQRNNENSATGVFQGNFKNNIGNCCFSKVDCFSFHQKSCLRFPDSVFFEKYVYVTNFERCEPVLRVARKMPPGKKPARKLPPEKCPLKLFC